MDILPQTKTVIKVNSAHESALFLASEGFRVFPVCGVDETNTGICLRNTCTHDVGKHPIIVGWQSSATTDPEEIQKWWHKWPDANVGIATGNGLFVLDVDPRHHGDHSLDYIQAKYGTLPDTLTVETGGGGWHYYFLCPDGVCVESRQGGLGPGLDIRGDKLFVVGPGSVHVSGRRYKFGGGDKYRYSDIAQAPEWLIKLVTAPPKARACSGAMGHSSMPAVVPDGKRGNWLHSEASYFRDRYISRERTKIYLMALNNSRCKPPKSEKALEKILSSVFQEKNRRPSRKPGPSEGALRVDAWLRQRCQCSKGMPHSEFTVQEVADGTGLSKRWTRQCINNLERWGLLQIEEINGKPSRYFPLPRPGEEQGRNVVHSSLISLKQHTRKNLQDEQPDQSPVLNDLALIEEENTAVDSQYWPARRFERMEGEARKSL